MSSRRLAISSLLCDDGGPHEGHDSPSESASSPSGMPHPQERHQLPRADPTFDTHSASSRTQLASLINPVSTSPTLELQRNARHEVWEKRSTGSVSYRHGVGRSPDVPWPSPSPSSAGPPFSDRPSLLQQRTPSPVSHLHSQYPLAGPNAPRYVAMADNRATLSRDSVGYAKTVKPTPQPHQAFHFPLPPPPSITHPVDARDQERGNHRSHSPSSTSIASPQSIRYRPSPTSPRTFVHPLRQPTELPPPSHTSHRASHGMIESDVRRSPIISRSPEIIVRAPLRGTSSLSPTIPKSPLPDGLSGLDVLVQAATEERERIDVNRRLSGSSSVASVTNVERKLPSQSPPAPRSHLSARPTPLTPPPTASSQGVESYTNMHDDAWPHGNERRRKRRRSSDEHGQRSEFAPSSAWETHTDPQYKEPSDQNLMHVDASVPIESNLEFRSPYPTAMQHQRREVEDERSPKRHPTSLPSPVHPAEPPVSHASTSNVHKPLRHSPPRSKPKSRKPGSVALANLERGLRDVELSTATAKSSAGRSPKLKDEESTIQLLQPVPLKAPPKTQLLHSSNVSSQTTTAEEEVDDFFQSTFDSPKPEAKKINSSQKTVEARSRPSEQTASSAELPRQDLSVDMGYVSPSIGSSPAQFELGKEDIDEDLLKEIADVAGTTASDDEKTEYDDEISDHMEVDIENELLSMVDDIGNKVDAPRDTTEPEGRESSRPSEPPVDGEEPARELEIQQPMAPKTKGSKKVKKVKGKSEVDKDTGEKEAVKPCKELEESKATKTTVTERPKNAKSKGASKRAANTAAPHMSLPDDFPLVTSSGRLITKSKKSASGLSPSVDQEQHAALTHAKKKKVAAVEVASVASKEPSSRSRSVSAVPRDSVDFDGEAHHEPEPDAEDGQQLYCVCKTQYDENRVMIACDRCEDNWFHPSCVGIDDIDVELVDTFVCPDCIIKFPNMTAGTTYKPRCHAGLMHSNPKSSHACHRPARGLLSKYCSDVCGVRYMHAKICKWQENGGEVTRLWENVKDSHRLEGAVVPSSDRALPKFALAEIQSESPSKPAASTTSHSASEAEQHQLIHLESKLQEIVKEKERRRLSLPFISWQLKVLDLAMARAARVEQCGWDQRLMFGESEYEEYGEKTLESYEEAEPLNELGNGDGVEHESDLGTGFWCEVSEGEDDRKCARHTGWQKLRSTDFGHTKQDTENILHGLTKQEREIRKKIEDILRPEARDQHPTLIFKAGHKLMDGTAKKGKKRAPAVA